MPSSHISRIGQNGQNGHVGWIGWKGGWKVSRIGQKAGWNGQIGWSEAIHSNWIGRIGWNAIFVCSHQFLISKSVILFAKVTALLPNYEQTIVSIQNHPKGCKVHQNFEKPCGRTCRMFQHYWSTFLEHRTQWTCTNMYKISEIVVQPIWPICEQDWSDCLSHPTGLLTAWPTQPFQPFWPIRLMCEPGIRICSCSAIPCWWWWTARAETSNCKEIVPTIFSSNKCTDHLALSLYIYLNISWSTVSILVMGVLFLMLSFQGLLLNTDLIFNAFCRLQKC